MSIRNFAEGEFYHVYNRGTEKRDIYLDNNDWDRFQLLLYLCNDNEPVNLRDKGRTFVDRDLDLKKGGEKLIDIAAYCLMPNHFHILIKERTERGISIFMQKLLTAYTMYFNRKYERSGVLFQGKFKSIHVDTDRYLKYLVSYIHLNPVKLVEPEWRASGVVDLGKTVDFLERYTHSSYLDYLDIARAEAVILNRAVLPMYFTDRQSIKAELQDWLTLDQAEENGGPTSAEVGPP